MKKIFYAFLLIWFSFSVNYILSQEDFNTGFKPATKEQLEKIKEYNKVFKGEIKDYVDLSSDFPPPGDQGQQNSCVAWASTYATMSYYYHKGSVASYYNNDASINYDAIFSPAFIYNTVNGCMNRTITYPDAFEVLYNKGTVTWNDMPYKENDYCTKPETYQIKKASKYQIKDVYIIKAYSLNLFREILSNDYPILIGAFVDENFLNGISTRTNTYDFTWSEYNGNYKAGHAMVIVGYDDSKKSFKILNSWGPKWGSGGFAWITYSFMRDCIVEAYVIEP